MTEGPGTLRKYVVSTTVLTLVGLLSLAGAGRIDYSGAKSASARSIKVRSRGGKVLAQQTPQAPPREAPPRPINCTQAKCIALTFDDGPCKDTARLLGILKNRGVRATFFLVGQNVTEFPDVARQELADGHELGNHSWNHANLLALSTAGIRSQIARTQEAIQKLVGITPKVFRPPYGNTNARVASVARQFGLPQFLWEVDPLDWKDRNTATVERRVLGGTQRGDIVLMHDVHPTTVTAVPDIIDKLAKEGFVFVTVSELFGGQLTPGREYSRLDQPPPPQPSPSPSATPSATSGTPPAPSATPSAATPSSAPSTAPSTTPVPSAPPVPPTSLTPGSG